MIKSFNEFLLESKGDKMLDIHIPEVSKVFKKDSAIEAFLSKEFRVTEKTDGVKITLQRDTNEFDPSDYSKNWIVSYKGFILFPFEHDDVDHKTIKKESIGNSQFAFVHALLKKVQSKLGFVPKGEEFFLEYLMKKPTLTRTYGPEGLHKLILIAHSPSSFSISSGKISSSPSNFIQGDNLSKKFSKITGIKEPPVIFKGKLIVKKNENSSSNEQILFNEEGIVSEKLRTRFNEIKEEVNEGLQEGGSSAISVLHNLFTSYSSEFGGDQIEGSVLKSSEGKFYKFVAHGQYSKEDRAKKKEEMVGSKEDQEVFFSAMEKKAEEIFSSLDVSQTVEKILEDVSSSIYKMNLSDLPSEKKTNLQKQDDLYLKVKTMVLDSKDSKTPFALLQKIKGMKNLGFFIGKIRIPTTAHFEIISSALKKNPRGVIVALVSTKKASIPFDDRKKILEKEFGKKIRVIEVPNGNLSRVLEPFKDVVSTLFCGEDRKKDYSEQLKKDNELWGTNITLDVESRTDGDVSSSKVEEAVKSGREDEFRKLTPKLIWSYWDRLKDSF